MKNVFNYCKSFILEMNNASVTKETINPIETILNIIKKQLPLICVSIILSTLISCERNAGSGCGTWPRYESKNSRSFSKHNNQKIKNERRYAYYKGYN